MLQYKMIAFSLTILQADNKHKSTNS